MEESAPPTSPDKTAEELMRALHQLMEAESDAQALNDHVITPFAAALEEVCAARGYVLNIYGEKSNIVFTRDREDAEAIYQLVEDFLNEKQEAGSGETATGTKQEAGKAEGLTGTEQEAGKDS